MQNAYGTTIHSYVKQSIKRYGDSTHRSTHVEHELHVARLREKDIGVDGDIVVQRRHHILHTHDTDESSVQLSL